MTSNPATVPGEKHLPPLLPPLLSPAAAAPLTAPASPIPKGRLPPLATSTVPLVKGAPGEAQIGGDAA